MSNLAEFIAIQGVGLVHVPCGGLVAYLDARPTIQYLNRAADAHTCPQENS